MFKTMIIEGMIVRVFGVVLLLLGIVILFCSLAMDTSVMTEYGSRVNNFGLMRDQQNYLIVGAVVSLVGVLMALLCNKSDSTNEVKCPFCAEKISIDAIKCKHCGSDVSLKKSHDSNLWIPALYFSLEDGVPELNRGAIADLVCGIVSSESDLQGENLKKKYENRIHTLANGMPSSLRNPFLNYYSELMEGN